LKDRYPPPIAVLTDLVDQWVLFWVSNTLEVSFARTIVTAGLRRENLDRDTALEYLRIHLLVYSDIDQKSAGKKRTAAEMEDNRLNKVFGQIESQFWASMQSVGDNRLLDDFGMDMTPRELEDMKLKQAWEVVARSNLFPPAAEAPCGMYS
jgi:hypothetical protein